MNSYLRRRPRRCFLKTAVCKRHGTECPIDPPDDGRWTLNISGLNCIPYTTMGSQLGLGDPLIESQHTRANEQPWKKKTFATVEESPNMQPHIISESVPHLVWLAIIASPKLIGIPIRRLRRHMFGYDNELYIWCGPEPHRIQSHFEELFFAEPVLDINSLMLEDTSHKSFYKELAKSRGLYLNNEHAEDLPAISGILPPGGCQRFIDYDLAYEELRKLDSNVEMMADLSQDPTKRPRQSVVDGDGQGEFQTQLQSSLGYSFKFQRLISPHLLMRLHGYPEDHVIFNSGYSSKLLQQWCGDGFHLGINAAWFLYCFSHVYSRSLIAGDPTAGPTNVIEAPEAPDDDVD